MSTALEPEERVATNAVRIAHAYCVCQEPVGRGSTALCGYVKQNGPQPANFGHGVDTCVVCDDLYFRPCSSCGRRWV